MASKKKTSTSKGKLLEVDGAPSYEFRIDEFWKPSKEGEERSGEVVAIEEGEYGKFALIRQANKKIVATPSHMSMQRYVDVMKPGMKVRCVFVNFYKAKKGKGRNYKVYEI